MRLLKSLAPAAERETIHGGDDRFANRRHIVPVREHVGLVRGGELNEPIVCGRWQTMIGKNYI